MKFFIDHTFPYQIEILPRLTICFSVRFLIAFEFLFWSIGIMGAK